MNSADFGPTSAEWMAIDGSDGSLVTPTFTGTIAGGDYVPTTPNSVRLASSGTADYTLVGSTFVNFKNITNPGSNPVSADALMLLRTLCLYPVESFNADAYIAWNTGVELIPRRGGSYAGQGGIFAAHIGNARNHLILERAARPAFVL